MDRQKISFLREPKIVNSYDELFDKIKTRSWLKTKVNYTINTDTSKNIIASAAISEFLELKTDLNKIKELIETKHEFTLLLKRYFISILDNYKFNPTIKLSPEELEKSLKVFITLAYDLILYPIYSYRSFEFGLYTLLNIWEPVLLSSGNFLDFAPKITHDRVYHLILEKEKNIDRADFIQNLLVEFKKLIQLKEKYIERNDLRLSFLIKRNLNYCYNNFEKINSILRDVKYEIDNDLHKEFSIQAEKEIKKSLDSIKRREREQEERDKGIKRDEDENENNNDNGLSL